MRRFCCSLIIAVVLAFPCIIWGAPLDDYYLARYREFYGATSRLSGALIAPDELRERSPTMFLLGLKKDWQRLETSTRLTLAGALSGPPTLAGEQIYISPAGHFRIHYATSGTDAPSLVDANGNGIPDWVETVGTVFEFVFSRETGSGAGNFAYAPAPTAAGNPYDVYLKDLAATRQFGYTETAQPVAPSNLVFTSFMVIDKDFLNAIYGKYGGLGGLQITAAHEYHHAIQFGYNIFFEAWYAEATSTWMEDEVYDSINQLYSYATPYLMNTLQPLDAAVDVNTGGGYGRWLFNRYLAERLSAGVIRSVWQRLGSTAPPKDSQGNLVDIAMLPLINTILTENSSNLQEQFSGFARRIYKRDWASHASEIGLIRQVTPAATYSNYPVNALSVPSPAITLPRFSFAYVTLKPSIGAPTDLLLTLNRSAEIMVTALHKSISGTITEYPMNSANGTLTVPGFNSSNTQEAALLIINPTATENLSAAFTTDGSTPPTATVPVSPQTTTTQTQAASSSGGGSGCFIATAAYGSYLHPKVKLLRDFRDRSLLTNKPGRILVACYYRISPPLAEHVARHPLLRSICRGILAPIVFTLEHGKSAAVFFSGVVLLLIVLSGGARVLLRGYCPIVPGRNKDN